LPVGRLDLLQDDDVALTHDDELSTRLEAELFANVLGNDDLAFGRELGGRARINPDFYRSMTVYEPPIAPEVFDLCPLKTHCAKWLLTNRQ
jgi:hypothetical protein